ncbi:hypothetical protein CIB48_g6802 [Xylaria polymorpha]|nr:hypothetical protein CIB48_g6802 [Xylaria polymorpha]
MDGGDLNHIPVRPPPPGRTSNFTNPESRSYQLIILISVLSFLVVAMILMRLYSRLRVTRSSGLDDIFCVAATGSLADGLLAQLTSATTKVGFLVFYLRLFRPVTYVRYLIWAGMAVIITFAIVFFIIDLVVCVPRSGETWLNPAVSHRCNNISVPLVTVGAYFKVITDFYILFIPLHQLPRLRLSKKRKVGFVLIFMTGLLAAGSGLANLIIRSNGTIFDKSDFSWTIVPVYATTLVELNVGLICLSLPVVFILFVGRFTQLSRSVGSWIRERRSPRQSPHQSGGGGSSEHIAAPDDSTPQLPPVSDNTSFSGMRKFIRNVYRSQLQSSRGDTTFDTFDDQSPEEYNYHAHLKPPKPKDVAESDNSQRSQKQRS